jgi:threonine dehydratase
MPRPADLTRTVERLSPYVYRTPVLTSRGIDELCGCELFFKCENMQRSGSFKFRGAINALLQLSPEERRAGVITHSSGNHAQALALAGKMLGVPVCAVMPANAPAVKRAAAVEYGARVVPCEPTQTAREATVRVLAARHGYRQVHPYDDWQIIAGQATVACELLEQADQLDAVICPVGGGGLLAGATLAVRVFAPEARVFGAESAAADRVRRSLQAGHIVPAGDPRTVADGLRTSLGERPFAVIHRHVAGILTATESEILAALRLLWERLKLVVEPSAAVALAPLLPLRGAASISPLGPSLNADAGAARVGVILSGGNLDLDPFFQALATREPLPDV